MTVVPGTEAHDRPLTPSLTALHGVLAKIRDLNLPLISVCPANDVSQVEPDSDEPGSEEEPRARSEGGADGN